MYSAQNNDFAHSIACLGAAVWGNVELDPEVITSDAGCQWQAVGELCIVYIQVNAKIPNAWTSYVFASNLPPCKFGYTPFGILCNQDTGVTYIMGYTPDRQLYIRSDGHPLDNARLRGLMLYPRNQ